MPLEVYRDKSGIPRRAIPQESRTVNAAVCLDRNMPERDGGGALRLGSYNPATLVKPPAPQSAKRAMPTKEQARQALQAAERKDPELFLFLRLEATTGLRPGEVCRLWWQDVDLEAAEVLVGYNVVHVKGLPGGYIRKRTKSRHGDDRPIALDGRTVALLREHRARCEARPVFRMITCHGLPGSVLLFGPGQWDAE